jgi:hypothetical protein
MVVNMKDLTSEEHRAESEKHIYDELLKNAIDLAVDKDIVLFRRFAVLNTFRIFYYQRKLTVIELELKNMRSLKTVKTPKEFDDLIIQLDSTFEKYSMYYL